MIENGRKNAGNEHTTTDTQQQTHKDRQDKRAGLSASHHCTAIKAPGAVGNPLYVQAIGLSPLAVPAGTVTFN